MSLARNPPAGDRTIERLLELESAKHEALLALDPSSYSASTTEQVRLIAAGIPDWTGAAASRILELAERMRLNSALLLNLISISPHFALADRYTPEGSVAPKSGRGLEVRG